MSHYKNFVLRTLYGVPLVILFLIAFLFCACGTKKTLGIQEWMKDSSEVRVLCTTAQVADLVKGVGGNGVKVWVLIDGDLDPHSYELVKGDDEKISRADIVFCNGLHLEHGASLSSMLSNSTKVVAVGDAIAKLAPQRILKNEEVIDPHIWMDVSLWKLGLRPVLEALERVDPKRSGEYRDRLIVYESAMDRLHEDVKKCLSQVQSSKRYLMTSHDAFKYFVRAYLSDDGESTWMKRFAAPEGLAPDGQLSSVDIQRMIQFVSLHRLEKIFPESNVNQDSIAKIASAASELGLFVKVCEDPLYGDSMSGLSYFEMMKKNATTISENLQ